MRRILVPVVVAAVLGGPLLAGAHAGPKPSWCEIQRLLGYENVRECEDPDS